MLIEGNASIGESDNAKKVQSCLRFFKEMNLEKSKELTVYQLQIMGSYGTKMHQTFSQV